MANNQYDSDEITPIDYATLTVSNTAKGLADATPAITAVTPTVKRAVITLETDQVRWRCDGTAPTSSEGHLMEVGSALSFMSNGYQQTLNKIKFIRVTGDAALKITYYD